MISDNNYPELECAISDDKHFFKEPITLTNCGHSICRECLPKNQQGKIECKICGTVTERDLSNDKESLASKGMIKMCLENLFGVIENETKVKIDKLKNLSSNQNETIAVHVKYIEDELEIRVESLKIELDNYLEKFKSDLKVLKQNLIDSRTGIVEKMVDLKLIDQQFGSLQLNIKNKQNLNEANFYQCQSELRNLNRIIKELENPFYKLELNIPSSKMNKNLIGNLSFSGVNDELISTKLYEKIENGKFECYPTLYQPWGIIELSNNQILCASIYDSCNLTLHDENFELLRLVEKIDNKNFRPIGITSNNRDEIYINDEKSQSIIMVDMNFRKIKSISSVENFEFKNVQDIFCKNEYLYISDSSNKQIHILTLDLQFCDSIKLSYNPWKVRVSNTAICVNSSSGSNFYSLNNDYKLLNESKNGCCRINLIGNHFYEFSSTDNTIYCYDSKGDVRKKIDISKFKEFISSPLDGCILYNNDERLILTFTKKLFVKIY